VNEFDEREEFDEEDWLIPSYCPLCKKEFYPTPMWVYKLRQRRYCSYHCFREAQGALQYAYKYKPVEQYTLDGELVKTFRNAAQAAEHINCSDKSIRVACTKKTELKGYLWRYKKSTVKKGEKKDD
jgi:hypothetical protein